MSTARVGPSERMFAKLKGKLLPSLEGATAAVDVVNDGCSSAFTAVNITKNETESEEERLRRQWKRASFGLFSTYMRNCSKECDPVDCTVTGMYFSCIHTHTLLTVA